MQPQSLMILIAGPYRSGTGDDPEKMQQNLRNLESVALPLYRAGHIPSSGNGSHSRYSAKPAHSAPATPSMTRSSTHRQPSHRSLRRDSPLPGASKGADEDVRLANELGLPVYYRFEEVPGC